MIPVIVGSSFQIADVLWSVTPALPAPGKLKQLVNTLVEKKQKKWLACITYDA